MNVTVKLTWKPEILPQHVRAAHDDATQDVIDEASRRAPKRTGAYARSFQKTSAQNIGGSWISRVGSTMSSARVKEKGGYIEAQKHSTLFIPRGDGTLRRPRSVRVRATPTVLPAMRLYPEFFKARMRGRMR